MIDNNDMLFIWLESQLVHHQGFLNELSLDSHDRKAIELWHQEGLIQMISLPRPANHKGPVSYTHRVRFTDEAWDMAAAIRKEKAQVTSPDAAGSKKAKQEEQVEATGDRPYRLPDFENFLKIHGNSLTPPQKIAATRIFEAFNQPELLFWSTGKATGKSWLLKAIDQFITSLTKKEQ